MRQRDLLIVLINVLQREDKPRVILDVNVEQTANAVQYVIVR
jgi:hypothetical protein